MPLPQINIVFQAAASSAVARSTKGIVAVILKDAKANGALTLATAADIPVALTEANRGYLARTFLGYVNAPRKVLCYVLAAGAVDLTDALAWLATQTFDYLTLPPDADEAVCAAVKTWIAEQRAQHHMYKAVLPHTAADTEAIINVTTDDCKTLGTTLSAAQMCSRIAGLIAGTPMEISCTYAPLTEVQDVKRLTASAADAAVDAGELILIHDGQKVKLGRGVNSMTTVPQGKSEIYKKIKIIELLDMIEGDIRMTLQDTYVGKYANTYDNKLVLVTAISTYLRQLEAEGLLRAGSTIGIDLAAQTAYLTGQGEDVSEMSEQEIREAATGSNVFLTATITPLDAIEDVTLAVVI